MGRRALAGGGAVAVVIALLAGRVPGRRRRRSDRRARRSAPRIRDERRTAARSRRRRPRGSPSRWRLIDSGEPLPYEQDGATFQNREGLLPDEPEGYYREYTVETPGSDDRGARRLVIGEEGETYYTRDHYQSFISIDPEDFR